jgi:copper chaperone CopZ
MQVTLFAPDVTCEHCIATINRAVERIEGATFVSGNPDARSFVVEVTAGAVLDAIATATEAEGYPLGELSSGDHAVASAVDDTWKPEYRMSATDKGADINYACPCGCEAGFALDRSNAAQQAEGCCCGRELLVAPADAEARLRADVEGEGYRVDVQDVTMPWGQPMQAAIAIPVEA